MKILHVLASAKGEASNSGWLSQQIIGQLRGSVDQVEVTLRDLHAAPIPHIDGDYADALGSPADPDNTSQGSLALSEQLIREIEAADCLVIGTPMHNYTVPSSLKAWIDHVVRVRRSFAITPAGKAGLLRDRPVYVGIVSGGGFSGAQAQQPDFLRPYLTVALATIGLHHLQFFTMERSAAGAEMVHAERERVARVLMQPDFF